MGGQVSTEIEYPVWKSVVWRIVRTGLWGAIGAITAVQITLHPDFSNIKLYITTLIAAFITGFGSGAVMALREVLSGGDKESNVQKIPL